MRKEITYRFDHMLSEYSPRAPSLAKLLSITLAFSWRVVGSKDSALASFDSIMIDVDVQGPRDFIASRRFKGEGSLRIQSNAIGSNFTDQRNIIV